MVLPTDWFTPVTRIRRTSSGKDSWGQSKPGPEVRTALPPALLAWSTGAEYPAGPALATVQAPSALWPDDPTVDVAAGDDLEIHGSRWRVVGAPEHWPMGTRALLKQVTT